MNGTDVVTVTGAGDMGIGTTNPLTKIHVVSTDADTTMRCESMGSNFGEAGFSMKTSEGRWLWYMDDYTHNALPEGALGLFKEHGTGTSYVLACSSSGNVGIGTVAPSSILSFGGNVDRTIGMERRTTSTYDGKNLTIVAGGAKAGQSNKPGGDLIVSAGTSTGDQGSQIYFKTAVGSTSGTADRTPATQMIIDNTGNVGIGTTAPGAKLEVVGNVKATAFIATTSGAGAYKYNTSTNMTVPDYVFDAYFDGKANDNPEYHLTDLNTLKAYVKEHRHLPRVPSRKEIEKEQAVNVHNMTMVTLEKVEELTLYVLQLEEEGKTKDEAIKKIKDESNAAVSALRVENEMLKKNVTFLSQQNEVLGKDIEIIKQQITALQTAR